jgi:hypothetical protein
MDRLEELTVNAAPIMPTPLRGEGMPPISSCFG